MTSDPIVRGGDGFPAWAEGYQAVRELTPGIWLMLIPLTFGRLRIGIGSEYFVDEFW